MKLQILVPQYNETNKIIKPLLDSIALQQSVDLENEVGVVIVNDGTDVHLSAGFLNSYPYKIEYHLHKHKGVSATRNACLDYASAEYVMFCDADDMFFNACGLWMLFQEMDKGFDTLVSIFVEEIQNRENKKVLYVNHEQDSTFVHGKVHRRQYLVDQNIRWNEALTIHEDSYFNIICQALTENILYLKTPIYLWKWRDASVCRHDPKYSLKTFNNLIDSNDALVDNLIEREQQGKAEGYATMMIFNAYYTMNKPEWINQENKEYRQNVEKRFSKYFDKHKGLWESIDPKVKMTISNSIRSRSIDEGMGMERITIEQWLSTQSEGEQVNGYS